MTRKSLRLGCIVCVLWLFMGLLCLYPQGIVLFVLFITGQIPCYTDQGITYIRAGDRIIPAHVYKRPGAPFVIVGPYPFQEQSDFFFINSEKVVGRVLDDKISGDNLRLGKWLFICFDLSDSLDAMVPCFYFKAKKHLSTDRSRYIYELPRDPDNGFFQRITISIPADIL